MTDKDVVEVLKDLCSHKNSLKFSKEECREALKIATLKVGRGSGKTSAFNMLAGMLIAMRINEEKMKGDEESEI